MGTISVFTFSADKESVTRTKLNNLAANLVTEFNGNINNDNIKAAAGIVYSKLTLTNGIVNADINSSAAISDTKLDLATIAQNIAFNGTSTFNGNTTFASDVTFSGQTIADLGAVTTVDINGGTINGLSSLGMATGADITEIADEDDMISDSATKLATQQSIKAYIAGNTKNATLYTSNDTFVVPSGITQVFITMIAGGGSGGGCNNGYAGGGASGTAISNYPLTVTPLASLTVTVGAGGAASGASDLDGNDGGDSVFGSLTVTGGAGGEKGSVSTGGAALAGDGSAPTAGGLGIQNSGGTGTSGSAGGGGAGSPFGAGGNGGSSSAGANATGYGAGGGGAAHASNNRNGGAGSDGFVVVLY